MGQASSVQTQPLMNGPNKTRTESTHRERLIALASMSRHRGTKTDDLNDGFDASKLEEHHQGHFQRSKEVEGSTKAQSPARKDEVSGMRKGSGIRNATETSKDCPEKGISQDTNVNRSLDNTTLLAIKNYLSNGKVMNEFLEEEQVINFSVKTSRYANERTRYRQNILDGSDVEEGETFYDRVYKEEENYALASEFFNYVIHESRSLAQQTDESGKFEMHRKTVSWLKKATGLQRPYDPLERNMQLSDSDELDTDSKPRRRLTRGMARKTRVQRRQEKIRQETQGLQDLMAVVKELESQRGKLFPESRHVVSFLAETFFLRYRLRHSLHYSRRRLISKSKGSSTIPLRTARIATVARVACDRGAGPNHPVQENRKLCKQYRQ